MPPFAERLLKESPGSGCIAFGRQQKIDTCTVGVDIPVEVGPLALDANVGFVDPPVSVRGLEVWLQLQMELSGVARHPAPDRQVVH
jgi:hypothetical protein